MIPYFTHATIIHYSSLRSVARAMLVVGICLTGYIPLLTHGQTTTAPNNGTNNNAVTVEFCKQDDPSYGSRNAYVTAAPGTPTDLCVRLTNTSTSAVDVSMEFVDGTFTANTQRRSCSGGGVISAFGQYITDYEQRVSLGAGESKTITPRALFPAEKMGEQIGCLAYRVLSPDTQLTQDTSGMSIIVRNVQYIDIFVAGNIGTDVSVKPLVVEAETLREGALFAINRTSAGLVVGLRGENLGGIKQSVTVNALSISSVGTKVPLPPDSNVIAPNSASDFVIPLPEQPWYNIVRRAEVSVTLQAVLGNIDADLLDSAVLEPNTTTETLTYRVVPWKQLLVGVFSILAGFFIFRFAQAYRVQARQLSALQQSLASRDSAPKKADEQ